METGRFREGFLRQFVVGANLADAQTERDGHRLVSGSLTVGH